MRGEDAFRAHRGRLEGWLREGVDVRWEFALSGVEIPRDGNGKVVVRFENGVEVESEVVVGADGVHSSLRKSVLPRFSKEEVKILPYVVFNGKRRVSKNVFDAVYKPDLEAGKGSVVEVQLGEGVVLNVSVNEERGDGVVGVSWVYSRPARRKGDVLFKPKRAASEASMIQDEFYDEINSLSSNPNVEGVFREVFDVEKIKGEDRVLSWLMRSLLVGEDELKECEGKGVLFMGDAVHAEPILGGHGANAAIKDGIELAEWIAKGGKEKFEMWSESRYGRWREGIEESEKMIAMMHGEGRDTL